MSRAIQTAIKIFMTQELSTPNGTFRRLPKSKKYASKSFKRKKKRNGVLFWPTKWLACNLKPSNPTKRSW